MTPQELKRLQTTEKQLSGEIDALMPQISELQKRVSALISQRDKVKAEIKRSEQGPPVVSEHAILRYLERKYELDIEEVKREIITDKVLLLVRQLGDGKYPLEIGGKIVIKNNVVVSVI